MPCPSSIIVSRPRSYGSRCGALPPLHPECAWVKEPLAERGIKVSFRTIGCWTLSSGYRWPDT